MIARAPGKLILSGAYSVLAGAPAIVAAVDRYVIADASRPAERLTDEVRAAVLAGDLAAAPWFDATALRAPDGSGGTRKLGLGSSAAILVASLATGVATTHPEEDALRAAVLERALLLHRAAQQGGSGVDVAASALGGVLACRRDGERLDSVPHPLPPGLVVEVFASPRSASTPGLIARLTELRRAVPERVEPLLADAMRGAEEAVRASTVADFVAAIARQFDAFAALADAGLEIVPPETAPLREAARAAGATFGPSGAGGGDVSIHVGAAPPSTAFRAAAAAAGLTPLPLALGARGLHTL